MVLQHWLLRPEREWLRGRFLLPVRIELLQRWRMLSSRVSNFLILEVKSLRG